MQQLVFLINCPQEYLSHTDAEAAPEEANRFFMTISEVFLPLLEMFSRLERDKIPCRLSLVLPPSTLTMLDDPFMQSQFVASLEKRIDLGSRLLSSTYDALRPTLTKQIERFKEQKRLFQDEYGSRLLPVFAHLQKCGAIELLATCGTSIFLPHYIDIKETISAQVETGLYAYKTFFSTPADGFFLPEMGYETGIEQILKSYGVRYTPLDARAVMFSCDRASCGIFSPVQCLPSWLSSSPLVAFPRDNSLTAELFTGYAHQGVYCDTEKDLAFSAPEKVLDPFIPLGKPRFPSLYRLTNRNGKPYDSLASHEAAMKDAKHFLEQRLSSFSKAANILPDTPLSFTLAIDAQDAQNWAETLDFLECTYRLGHAYKGLSFATFKDVLKASPKLHCIRAYFSSASESGYCENLLNGMNSFMLPAARRASIRMTLLAERFTDASTLKSRLLNLAAKHLMLCQSSAWQKRLSMPENSDGFAAKSFSSSLDVFSTVFDSLASNSFSPSWLTALEAASPIFPWLNYKIFCKKR